MDITKIILLIKPLVIDLVNRDFDFIVESGRNGPYTVGELEELIEDYGGQLTLPPEDDFLNLNIIKIEDEPEYAVEYELWVNNEKSDLTLSCIIREEREECKISIENIHVM